MANDQLTYEEARAAYWEAQPDVKAANFDPWAHYVQYGQGEGRPWPGATPYAPTSEPASEESAGSAPAAAGTAPQTASSTPASAEFPDFLEGLLPFLTGGAHPMAHAEAAAKAREFAERATAALPGIVAGLSSAGSASSGGAFDLNTLLQSILNPRAAAAAAASASTDRAPATGETTASSPAIHHGVQCDVCGVSPITGPRYKSTTLHDFDLCSNCEETFEEGTPYIKIKTPGQWGRGRWGRGGGRCGPPPFGGPGHHGPGPHGHKPHHHGPPPGCFPHGGPHAGFGGGYGGRWKHNGFGGKGWQGHCAWRAEQQQQQDATASASANAAAAPQSEGENKAAAASTESALPAEMQSPYEIDMQNAVHASLVRDSSAETPATTATAPAAATEDAVMTEAAPTEQTNEQTRSESPTFSDNDYDILETTPLTDGVTESKSQEPVEEKTPAATPASPVAATTTAVDAQTAQQQRAKRWQKELVSFAGMGFTDFPKLLDLFETHISSPGGSGTDKVLDALLSG